LEVAAADASIIIGQQENLAGYRVTPQFFDAWSMKAGTGSLFTDSDLTGTQSIVVLGSQTAALLAGEGNAPATLVGKKILTRQGYQTVVGILQDTGKAVYDEAYFTPYRSGAAGFGGGPPMRSMNTQLRFSVADPEALTETAARLTEWFDSQYGEGRIVVSNPRAETERLMARNTGIGLLILFLSLAGLFIASVNVSNILMGRGLRMRKNVGILMALGASRVAIIKLFAKEALAISAAGSFLGALLALPLSTSMRNALGITGGSGWYLLAGIAAAWIPTIIFSLMPARQNSMIDPAQAMRVA
jgi:putative ABC transport system permease protein